MVTTDVIGRVYFLRIKDNFATGFFIDVNGQQYLITAKHFAINFCHENPMLLFFENSWNNFNAKLISHAEGDIDISVFRFGEIIANTELILEPNQAIYYGQDVYFLGFPYGEFGDAGKNFPCLLYTSRCV